MWFARARKPETSSALKSETPRECNPEAIFVEEVRPEATLAGSLRAVSLQLLGEILLFVLVKIVEVLHTMHF